jgi:hypothetical protein
MRTRLQATGWVVGRCPGRRRPQKQWGSALTACSTVTPRFPESVSRLNPPPNDADVKTNAAAAARLLRFKQRRPLVYLQPVSIKLAVTRMGW